MPVLTDAAAAGDDGGSTVGTLACAEPPTGAATTTPPSPYRPDPPAPPPLFGAGWPGPGGPPPQWLLGTAAATGVAVAATVPLNRPGIGWFLAALAGAVAAVVVRWRAGAERVPRRVDLESAAWIAAAVGLAGVAAVRDAEWLAVLCLLAAVAAGSLAIGGRSFRGVTPGVLAVPAAMFRSLPWLGRAARAARKGDHSSSGLRLAASLLVGVLLLVVFGTLLASADPAFDRVLGALLPAVDEITLTAWVVLFGLGAVGVVAAGFVLIAPPRSAAPDGPPSTRLRTVDWVPPVGLLVALFALFVGVQFTTLFGTDDYVRRTTGVTYAEYARGGFWQLLGVTVLALLVIVLALRWAPVATSRDRAWKRALLGVLTCLTLVIVASALSRMWLYQQAYGFTVLRLLVLTCELWLGACFVLVLVAVVRLRPGRPVRGMVATGVAALLALAVLDPERFVAEQDVARFAATGGIDIRYLAGLSADAVPALARLPEPQRSCALGEIALRVSLTEVSDWRSANASRAAAAPILAGLGASCGH